MVMSVFNCFRDSARIFKKFSTLDQKIVRKALQGLTFPGLAGDLFESGYIEKVDVNGFRVFLQFNPSVLPDSDSAILKRIESECRRAITDLHKRASLMVEVKKNRQQPPQQEGVRSGATQQVKQADAIIHKSLLNVKNIVAVASGKGGVGKSSTAVNLAYALRQKGQRVGLLDADVYGPSVTLMTKAGRPSEMNDDLIIPPQQNDVKIIGADMFSKPESAQILRGPMVGQIVRQLLTQVDWGELDFLIIDYPPGTGDIQLTLSQTAQISSALIVTTPQDIALADVRKAIDMFHTLKVPIVGVVETMSYFLCDSCEKKHQIFPSAIGGKGLANEMGLKLLAEIPIDPRLAESADKGVPVITFDAEAPASKSFLDLADSLIKEQDILNQEHSEGLLQFSLEWEA